MNALKLLLYFMVVFVGTSLYSQNSPTITCPMPNPTIVVAPSSTCSAQVIFANATAIDPDDLSTATVSQTQGLPSGSDFPVGDHIIEFTAMDNTGDPSSTCTFTIRVLDNEAPTALCRNITVQLDDTGNVTIAPENVDNGSSDNCGAVTLSLDTTSFTCAQIGDNTVTLTVTDGSGNTNTCTATVTVEDVTAPMVICQDVTVQLDDTGNVTIAPEDINNGSSDNCGAVTLALDTRSFTCAEIGSNTVTLTVTDGAGNAATCTATVTVEDTTAPMVLCQDITVQLDDAGNATIAPEDIDNGSSDSCGAVTLALDTTSFTCAEIGSNTVTLTVTDGSGNTATCTATVTVEDVTAPMAVCQDITVQLDDTGNITIAPGDIDNGSSDNCGAVTLALDTTSFTCAEVGDNTVTLTVTDGSGNTASCMATVTVIGFSEPIIACPMDVTTNSLPGECGAIVSFADAIATSDCGAVTITQTMGLPSGSLFPIGINTVEYTATAGGLTSTCQFTITVEDDQVPVAVCQDITVQLDATGSVSITAEDVDNGSMDNCGDISLSLDITSFTCAEIGDNTVTLTATDDSGNTATCTATVTVEDTIAPVITCIGQAASISDIQDFETTSIPNGWTTSVLVGDQDWEFGSGDLPTGDDFPTFAAIFNDDAAGSGEVNKGALISPTYNIENASSANLSYDVAFQEFGNQEFSVEVWDGNDWQQIALYDEDLDPDIQSESFDILAYANVDFQVRFSYDDLGAWGWHAAIDNFNVTYEVTANPLEVVLDANGMASLDLSELILSIEDSCDTTISIEVDNSCEQANGSNEFENGYFADPGSGFVVANDILVEAGTDFIMNQVSMNLFHDSGATIATADFTYHEDNGGEPGAIIGSETGLVPTSQNVVGNNFGFDVSETVFSITPFTFASAADTNTNYWVSVSVVSSSGGITAWEVSTASGAGSYDALSSPDGTTWNNPGAGSDGVYTFSGTCGDATSTEMLNLDCSHLGLNQFEISVTDTSGNTSTCTATVEVKDETAPVLICQDVTIEVGPDGTTEIDPEMLLANVPSTFNAMVIGSDNQSSTEGFTDFTVGVTADVVVSFDWDFTLNDLPGFDSFGYLLNGTYTQLTDPAQGNQDGSETVNLVAGDVFGFRAQTDDNIFGNTETLVTNFVPGFDGQFAPENWTLNLDNSDGDAFFIEIPGGPLSFDACGITVLATDITEVTCDDIGTTITATVFASDASGNIASCTSQITVVDVLAPQITCPADQTQSVPAGSTYSLPDYFGTGEAVAIDNCTDPVTIVSQDPAAGTELPEGSHVITLIAEDEYGNQSMCTFELTVEATLGVSDIDFKEAISMFPNPANQFTTLESNIPNIFKKISVYDLNGKLVHTVETGHEDDKSQVTLDVSHLASGVYAVQVLTEQNTIVVKKLVKE